MHLLNTETLKLEEFIGKSIPPYAILSHVWGEDEFELSFEDLKHHDINTLDYKRAGYSKVKNTCKNAVADGLKYVWIDTCCVDHTSSAELFEVINYMFSFYRKSEVCYVYLADINITDGAQHESLDFGSSRWFSRGWTLQELLAPSVCKFFDSNWEFIGTRFHLSKTISEVTGIHPRYLRSEQDPREASCPSKMNWLSRRECTRAEDIAYCVSGLFDLNLPLLYGEGERTFQRLQKEILKQRKDTGVFSWYWDASVPDNWGSIFAPRPRLFDSSGLTPPISQSNVVTSLPTSP
ncbi:heterokaryon incompatibility protein-domain-containing protein [Hypomontagnella monticulosa]|nr:heterokaryon incompatibility protein-domain-containing protein [Hypomontagnella monticulosa]